ncbi:MAG: M3 family metallopeptidase [Chlorobi bacterium]|nr:M3 family metallopeptidase [Chlorobiota bacterium]
MKRFYSILIFSIILFAGCKQEEKNEKKMTNSNPLLAKFDTPFEVPPFDKIKNKHYMPAFKEAMKIHKEEIDAIVNNKDSATFENTIVAMDNSGELLINVSSIFYALKSADTNDSINQIAKEVSPLLSKHKDDIALNEKLFKRIKSVYDNKEKFNLNTEQMMLLKKTYEDFVRGGANLPEDKKERFREINKKLSMLTLQFGENLLNENNGFYIVIDKKEDLSGLPNSVIQAAAEAAKEKEQEGKWIFTVQKSSIFPFITYSDKRNLREKLFKAYINRGDNNNENDNKKIIKEIVNLRIEKANLLGYNSHANFILDVNMAKEPKNVYDLLNKVWGAALPVAKKEAEDLQAMIKKDGKDFTLEPWDWWYYSEKIRKEKYDLNEEELRPYFKLENVREGMFKLAENLYGITFTPLKNFPVYHKDAEAFEVKEADGTHIGIFYTDYFPRESKKGGAWMTSFRKQSRRNGKNITPVIMNVMNFTKPTADKPSLLSFEEVETMFHEFGHALHGLLSDCTYEKLSGTSVARDFVELPSQIMENWASEPEMLKIYAKHYKTGEVIPDELIAKLQNSSKFNQGFRSAEYLAASFLDMAYHTLTKQNNELDVNKFEGNVLSEIGLPSNIVSRYRSTNFAHIFSGGYSSGYYGYEWAAVLDADAFEAFKETSLFDKETANKFRKEILSKGGTDDPMTLYKNFRGKKPSIEPLLKRKGLL